MKIVDSTVNLFILLLGYGCSFVVLLFLSFLHNVFCGMEMKVQGFVKQGVSSCVSDWSSSHQLCFLLHLHRPHLSVAEQSRVDLLCNGRFSFQKAVRSLFFFPFILLLVS